MGFTAAKRQVVDCLRTGQFLHEVRGEINVKNLLAIGSISANDVADIISRSKGGNYSTSPHDFDSKVDVHILKNIEHSGLVWYVKWYFSDPNSVFISVHN